MIDDIQVQTTARSSSAGSPPMSGTSASRWRLCPSSNLQTGAADSYAEHPIGAAAPAALPGHRQHRQPADVPHQHER
ncbi:hypothetical protein ACRAWF_36490 [Streptomyces sp. L7]